MKVAVIIVTYNPKQWLEKCFESLRSSSIPVKTVVVDNGSTDGSPLVIREKFPEVELIQSNINLGFGAANNIGIQKAYNGGADFIFLLNQDAWIEPNTLSRLVEVAVENKEYGILSPIHYNGNGTALDYNFSTFIGADRCKGLISDYVTGKPLKDIYQTNFVNAAAWLLTRNCIETVGGFNPSFFHYAEDLNYADRASFHQLKIGIVPSVKIFHDRENRSSNLFLQNDKLHFSRIVVRELSRPELKKSVNHFYLVTLRNMLKYLSRGDQNSFSLEKSKLTVLWRSDIKSIKRNRNLSLKKKGVFLDLE